MYNKYVFHFLFLQVHHNSFHNSVAVSFGDRSAQCYPSNSSTAVRNTDGKLLDPKKIKDDYHKTDFALRGSIHLRTREILEELKQNETSSKLYTSVIRMGIVDGQSMGQKPMTFLRQVVVLVSFPELMNNPMFPTDVVQRANELLSDMKNRSPGSSTGERGLELVRKKVRDFISKRDGFPVNLSDIYLTDGVTGGVDLSFNMVQQECNDTQVGIMAPSPLYPLYSAIMQKKGLVPIKYNLNPDDNWALDVHELERAYKNATCFCNCTPRVLLIINPGNPSGKILRRNAMEEIVKFAYNHNLILFADEIYQNNLFKDVPFISMNKVIREMGAPYDSMELLSFNSISKGYIAEVGLRGGYLHAVNLADKVHDVMFKMVSVKQCPNTMGQVGLYTLVHPPLLGEPSYDLYNKEVGEYFRDHKAVAKFIVAELNKLEGFHCFEIEGGPVAFTKFKIPEKAVKEAESRGLLPDIFYGMELLEQVGLNVAVGTAFGLSSTQHYMRLALPVKVADVEKAIARLKPFHEQFLLKYA